MTERGRIEDWIKIARKDLERSKRNLQFNDINAAGFYLQQCIEKYLKAFLIERGWKLKKIHQLDALLDEAMKFLPELSVFKEFCARVSSYYLADRYPAFLNVDKCIHIQVSRRSEHTEKLGGTGRAIFFPNVYC